MQQSCPARAQFKQNVADPMRCFFAYRETLLHGFSSKKPSLETPEREETRYVIAQLRVHETWFDEEPREMVALLERRTADFTITIHRMVDALVQERHSITN